MIVTPKALASPAYRVQRPGRRAWRTGAVHIERYYYDILFGLKTARDQLT